METKLQAFQKNRSKNMLSLSLQEQLLQEAFQKRKDITLILLKGLHVKGMQQLVYKHAISTIRF
ncbi:MULTISPECIES: RNA chaperone Hfq [Bacillus cereus group]|uniref:RNA-binding protein hfq n=2 Tax=Bacillus thuringiensis TaxID=1428 RepID=A0A9X6V5A1_BACTU|nr:MULTISPECIES: RNA chaperone Hfq [Bacillus cereus group]QUW68416.1 RNA chaperone Hfq [Pseudomonas synxantha]AMR88597.1 RNA-binding protein hfq [Bacillus thuringiensis]AQY42701.1 RNA-binding protein hfq [Bacillus thuringiensis]EEM93066.1 RNA chaperone Hfq [Bacillus thuringiensis IBL 200]EXY05128.1 RNA-binding protein [Bacillus thuringiensis]